LFTTAPFARNNWNPDDAPLHVATPALFNVRVFRNIWTTPGKVIPPFAFVAPVPLIVPPVQVSKPVIVKVPAPVSVPAL